MTASGPWKTLSIASLICYRSCGWWPCYNTRSVNSMPKRLQNGTSAWSDCVPYRNDLIQSKPLFKWSWRHSLDGTTWLWCWWNGAPFMAWALRTTVFSNVAITSMGRKRSRSGVTVLVLSDRDAISQATTFTAVGVDPGLQKRHFHSRERITSLKKQSLGYTDTATEDHLVFPRSKRWVQYDLRSMQTTEIQSVAIGTEFADGALYSQSQHTT